MFSIFNIRTLKKYENKKNNLNFKKLKCFKKH